VHRRRLLDLPILGIHLRLPAMCHLHHRHVCILAVSVPRRRRDLDLPMSIKATSTSTLVASMAALAASWVAGMPRRPPDTSLTPTPPLPSLFPCLPRMPPSR
jgi:hypothetical protein